MSEQYDHLEPSNVDSKKPWQSFELFRFDYQCRVCEQEFTGVAFVDSACVYKGALVPNECPRAMRCKYCLLLDGCKWLASRLYHFGKRIV